MKFSSRDTKEAAGSLTAPLFIGTAGWSIPRDCRQRFECDDPVQTHLQAYAQKLSAVEINSSFYRSHKRSTYERWAADTPEGFRFSVKLPRSITHIAQLERIEPVLQQFTEQATGLGSRLGCLLVQLPPSLALNAPIAENFFRSVRTLWGDRAIALEPRHESWFTPASDALLVNWRVARVLADPARSTSGFAPGGCPGLVYCRLHGSPREYYSSYEPALLEALAKRLSLASSETKSVWCIFDNTASGAAADNALDLQELLAACKHR